METAIPEGFTVFAFPQAHQCRLRTANAIERVSQELKRCPFDCAQGTRARVASIFPKEASLPCLCSALLAEISGDWEAGKIYLDMNPSLPPFS